MKKIRQQVETNFIGIELSDAIVIAPLMDALRTSIGDEREIRINDCNISYNHACKMYVTLANMGFVCTDGTANIPEELKDN